MAHLQASGSYNVITTHAPKTLSPEEACQLLRNLRLILRKFISNLHRRAKRLSREIARQKFIETNISPVFKLGRGGIAGKAAHRDAVTYRKVSAGDLGSEPGERPRRRAASAKLASFETEVDVGVDDDSTVYRDFCSLCTAFRQVMTICSVSPPTIQSPSRGLPTLAELAARTLALQLETCAHDARHDRHFRGLAEGDHHGDEFDSATFEEWYHIVPSHSIRHVLPTHAAAIILETLRETSTGIVALRECVGGWLVSCCLDHDRIHEVGVALKKIMRLLAWEHQHSTLRALVSASNFFRLCPCDVD